MKSFMGGEGFFSKSFSSSFWEPVSWSVVVINWSLENIITVSGEPGWSFNSSLDFLIIRWFWIAWWFFWVSDLCTWSVWRSCIGWFNWVISVCFLDGLIFSVIFNWIKIPDINGVLIVWLWFWFVNSWLGTNGSNKGCYY